MLYILLYIHSFIQSPTNLMSGAAQLTIKNCHCNVGMCNIHIPRFTLNCDIFKASSPDFDLTRGPVKGFSSYDLRDLLKL